MPGDLEDRVIARMAMDLWRSAAAGHPGIMPPASQRLDFEDEARRDLESHHGITAAALLSHISWSLGEMLDELREELRDR